MKLSKRERKLLDLLEFGTDRKIESVERRSDREYDLRLQGTQKYGTFTALAWLWAIEHMTRWTGAAVANMTDHPDMSMAGDWSGVRDTGEIKLWAIFNRFVVPQIEG